jgi:hypothetical protein
MNASETTHSLQSASVSCGCGCHESCPAHVRVRPCEGVASAAPSIPQVAMARLSAGCELVLSSCCCKRIASTTQRGQPRCSSPLLAHGYCCGRVCVCVFTPVKWKRAKSDTQSKAWGQGAAAAALPGSLPVVRSAPDRIHVSGSCKSVA